MPHELEVVIGEAINIAFYHIAMTLDIEQGDLDPLTDYQLREIFRRWIQLNSIGSSK